jgi:Outer membrane lipoprotein-sorting protein
MKNISLTINVLLLLSIYIAPVKMTAQTKNADDIIEKTSRLYKEWGGMDVYFSANIRSEKNNISENFEGTIIMKNNKFVLKTPDMSTWFDGTTLWSYMPRNKEVNISAPSGSELRLLNPMFFLQDHKKDFNVSYIGESTSANARIAYDIALVPKKKDDIEKIEVQIEKNTSLPVKLVVLMRNDVRSTVSIKEIKQINPPERMFSFNEAEYPGVEMIDLR